MVQFPQAKQLLPESHVAYWNGCREKRGTGRHPGPGRQWVLPWTTRHVRGTTKTTLGVHRILPSPNQGGKGTLCRCHTQGPACDFPLSSLPLANPLPAPLVIFVALDGLLSPFNDDNGCLALLGFLFCWCQK